MAKAPDSVTFKNKKGQTVTITEDDFTQAMGKVDAMIERARATVQKQALDTRGQIRSKNSKAG